VEVLERFYAALRLSFRRESIGDLPANVPQAIEALAAEVRERYSGEAVAAGADLLAKAASHHDKWQVARPRGHESLDPAS
jgi:uncharacterized protein YfaS (alpha-2-macroglobulin family)